MTQAIKIKVPSNNTSLQLFLFMIGASTELYFGEFKNFPNRKAFFLELHGVSRKYVDPQACGANFALERSFY
jgi:hypothetical protein